MFQGIDPAKALEMVQHSKVIAFDTETTGLTINDKVVGWVFTDHAASVYVPVRHSGGGNILHVDEFERVLALAFKDRARRGYRTVGHNIGFDLRMATKHGIFPEYPLEDSMINEALICDITKGYGLDDCCSRYHVTAKLGDAVYREIASKFGGMPDRKSMAHFHKLAGDNPVAVDYATGDGISTLELWKAQQKPLDDDDLRRVHELECKLIHRVARMHHRGMKVDMKYGESLVGKDGLLAKQIEEAQNKFPPGFNTNSPKDVEAIYRRNGFQDGDFAKTATGQPSFTEAWLRTNDIGENIIAVRQLKKARDSFVTPLMESHNVIGRVHPTLNQSKSDEFGAIGARFSCTEPNLQAFPKRNKQIGRLVRRLIIPDDGYEICEADYRQQEPRLFAYFSEDSRLLDGYRSGTLDIHDITSKGLGLPRDTAKRLAMGILTGLQPKGLAGHMKWTLEQAEAYHSAFLDEQFPAIKKFQAAAKNIFKTSGYVRSILGRRARLDDPKFAYRSVSRIIQNSGGDLMKLTLLKACEYAEANPQFELLMTVHDSLIWQHEKGTDPAKMQKEIESVADELKLGLPFPFDIGVGSDWAAASYGS